MSADGFAQFWESVYSRRPVERVSWYQAVPFTSLRLIDDLELPFDAAIIDVGGGASTLVDHLLATGRTNLTVLDLSASALQAARQRLATPDAVTWIREDVLVWEPQQQYADSDVAAVPLDLKRAVSGSIWSSGNAVRSSSSSSPMTSRSSATRPAGSST
jgi:Methyltransferase domain